MTNSRDKGKRGEREWAKVCNDNGYNCRRGCQYNGLDGDDVIGLPGVHIEVKRVEKLNIYDAICQSVRDSKGRVPIVAHRKNNCDWLVTMRAEDWFKLYRSWDFDNLQTEKECERMITYTCDVCGKKYNKNGKPDKWMELNHIMRYALVCSAECGKKWFDKVIPEEAEKTKMLYATAKEEEQGGKK